ncbi:MAG: hypothetical protein AAF617_07225 [Bacteroidota bacterium]
MSVNLIAIFPKKLSEETTLQLLDTIEKQQYPSIQSYYSATIAAGFPHISSAMQWYLFDEIVSGPPQLPDINATLALPEGISVHFQENGLVLLDSIGAYLTISVYPRILEKFQEICKEIAKDINTTECCIMGDDNPIYNAFNLNKDFELTATNNLQVTKIHDLYQEIKFEGESSYEIKGHYKLKLL